MTIQTYSDLQTTIANWIARADLAASIPDSIVLFESAAIVGCGCASRKAP